MIINVLQESVQKIKIKNDIRAELFKTFKVLFIYSVYFRNFITKMCSNNYPKKNQKKNQ